MSARQLHLFDLRSELRIRVGEAFFEAVPREPGVYIMTGRDERVLYVGQSKNLRVRLASYKNAQPDRAPRKVMRLVSEVERIVWEKCSSEQTARLRENELLRLHRPKFNALNVWPKAYTFMWLSCEADALDFGRTNEPEDRPLIFGAFKGGAVAGFAAMLRLTWAVVHRPESLHALPRQILQPKPPRRFRISFPQRHTNLSREHLLDCCR